MTFNAQLINQCVEERIEKSQSKAPTSLEQWPLVSNSKVLVGHSERRRQRQTDDFADGSANLKGGAFFCEEVEVEKAIDFCCTSFLSPANDEWNRSCSDFTFSWR